MFIHIYTLRVCPFFVVVSNKRQNGWTDRAQILCGTSHDHREGLWMIKISKICLQQNSIFIRFWKSTKFCFKIRALFCLFLFYNVYKEKMFSWNRRWARRSLLFYLIKTDIYIYVPSGRPNGWTEWAKIFCGQSRVAWEWHRLKKLIYSFHNFSFFHGQHRALQLVELYNK